VSEGWRQQRFAPISGTPLGSVAEIADGGGREFVFGDGKHAFRLVLLRDGETVYGFVNSCPHFGTPLNAGPTFVTTQRRVICVSHYARFRFRDGYCEDGPCLGASLEAIALSVEDGRIQVA
jgi:nitrite reductase/ring-hydroxylating ferredoxin subunit